MGPEPEQSAEQVEDLEAPEETAAEVAGGVGDFNGDGRPDLAIGTTPPRQGRT